MNSTLNYGFGYCPDTIPDIDAVIKRVDDRTEQSKENIMLLEEYIRELRERNDWLEAELTQKVNKGTPKENAISFVSGFEENSHGFYTKSENNLVTGFYTIIPNGNGTIRRGVNEFATLPVGYIPSGARAFPQATLVLNHAGVHSQYAANAYVHSSGYDPQFARMVIHIPYDLDNVTSASGTFFYYVK